MPIERNIADPESFNHELELPYQLGIDDFLRLGIITDVYDFFYDELTHIFALETPSNRGVTPAVG